MIAFCTQDPGGCPNAAGIGRTLYVYDGEGRRVLSQNADGTQTVYAYDAFGNLAAEIPGIRYRGHRGHKGSAQRGQTHFQS